MPTSKDGALEYYTYINTEQFKKDIREMIQGVDRVGDKTEKETKRMDAAFKKLSTAVAGYFTFQAATGFVRKLVQIRGEFQQLNIALETMLGNKEKADALMEQIKQLAATTPFQLTDVAQGAKQLLAYGFAAEDVTGVIKQLGDLAAGISAPLGDIVYLYGTLKAQGRAYTQDIRQFTNRGIPILQELVKVLGVDSVAAVNKMVTAGKVGFPEVKKALDAMTGSGGQFFNLMEKQSASITGQISNLQDQFEFMLNDLGKSSEGFISGSIELASELIGNYKEILTTLGTIAAGYGVYRAALVATIAIEKVQAALSLRMAASQGSLNTAQALGAITMGKLKKAWLALNTAMEANPIGLLVASLTGLVLLWEKWQPELIDSKNAIEGISEATKELAGSTGKFDDLVDKYNKLSKEANKSADETDELKRVTNELASIVPPAAAAQDNYGNIIKLNTDKIKDYREQLKQMGIDEVENANVIAGKSLNQQKKLLQQLNRVINNPDQTAFGINTPLLNQAFGISTLGAAQRAARGVSLDNKQLAQAYEIRRKTIENINNLTEQLKESGDRLISLKLGDKAGGVGFLSKYYKDSKAGAKEIKATFDGLLKDVSSNFKKLVGLAQNKDDLGKIKKGLQAKLDALAPSDAQTSELKAKILQVNKILESYKVVAPKDANIKPKVKITPVPELDRAKLSTWFQDLESATQEDIDKWSKVIAASAPNMRSAFELLLDDPINDTMTSLKSRIEAIKQVLSQGFIGEGGNKHIINPEDAQLLKRLLNILERLAKTGNELWNKMRELPSIFSDMGNSIGELDGGLGGTLNLMGGILTRAIDFRNSISEAKDDFDAFFKKDASGKIAGGLGNLIGGIAGSLGAIGAVVGVVTSIFSTIQKKQHELDQQRAAAIKAQNALLEKQYELTKKIYGVERIKAQQAVIKQAQDARLQGLNNIIKVLKGAKDITRGGLLSTLGLKKKSILEDNSALREEGKLLEKYLQSGNWDKVNESIDYFLKANPKLNASIKATLQGIQNNTELIENAGKKMQESLTGISFDSLTGQLVDMFKQGEISAEDFANKFEDLIKTAIIQGFSTKYVEKAMKPVYDMLAEFTSPESEEGVGLSKAELQKLKNAYNSGTEMLKNRWKQIEQITGIDFSKDQETSTNTGLAGQIKRSITEDTATELSGRINGMYLMTKKGSDNVAALLTVQKNWQQKQTQQLSLSIRHLAGIESNTLKTANNSVYLSYLKSIDGKLSNGKDAKRAGGVK